MAKQQTITRPAQAMELDYPELFQALVLLGKPLGRSAMLDLARTLELISPNGKAWTGQAINEIVNHCVKQQFLHPAPQGFSTAVQHRLAALQAAMASANLRTWSLPLLRHLHLLDSRSQFGWMNVNNITAGVRIAVYGGQLQHAEKLFSQIEHYPRADVLATAFTGYVDDVLIEAIDASYRQDVAVHVMHDALRHPDAGMAKLIDWGVARIVANEASDALRYRVLKQLLWRAQFAQFDALLGGDSSEHALFLRGDSAVMQCDYPRALTLYEAGLAQARTHSKARYGVMPHSSAWFRVAALLISDNPASLEAAATIARGEARLSTAKYQWSGLQKAIKIRSGKEPPQSLSYYLSNQTLYEDLTDVIVRAWFRLPFDKRHVERLRQWIALAKQTGFDWVAHEFTASIQVSSGLTAQPSLAGAFAQETAWQRTLSVMAALATEASVDTDDTRLVWIIQEAGRYGRPEIEAWEQKRNARGWNRGKKISFAKLARSETLDAHNARVAQALERETGAIYRINYYRALRALIGHPTVFFADNLATPAELVLAEPELRVTRKGQDTKIDLLPGAQQIVDAFEAIEYDPHYGENEQPCLLLRQTETRAHVIPLNTTHRRISQLVGKGIVIPPSGSERLRAAIDGAARHFTVHSDVATGATEAPGDATIRAELAPRGAGLRLQLAVRPFGEQGPRYTPGRGSTRVFARIGDQSQAVARDLTAERSALDAVVTALEAFPIDAETLETHCEDPTAALALVATLQALPELVTIEWPAGVKFKVSRTYHSSDLQLTLNRKRDWFTAAGGLALDDGEMLDLRQLIESARGRHGRFVPLGERGYVALSDELRRRIEEFALLDDATTGPAQLPLTAALAIAEATDGAQLQRGKEWTTTLTRIQEAQSLNPALPSTLQAELRAYQLDGYRWLSRLAHWGGGACLADDMGLGKTLQTIAVLLARAPAGPALVVAPTSVCQNWIDEARRFAPTLNLQLFEGAARKRLIESAAAFDVLVCSYTLLQQEIEAFSARTWHSLVLDEAQAVKNFSTKRAQAVLSLQAEFRIAATGTPVENRLEELWMLFRFLNPGLLGSRERFNQRFIGPIERGDAEVRAHLRRFIAPFVLRRTKAEVLSELPPRTEIVLTIEPEAEEQAFHEALRRSALEALADASKPPQQRRFQVLAELMRVRRACCDPTLVAPDAQVGSAKLDAFVELAQELIANRHKALVFSQFVDYLSLLRARLDELGIRYQYLDGSTPAAERNTRVKAFQGGDGDLFLISLRAGGVGLNLTAADYVIITDPWWNPAVEDQAASRAHRMGQERPVTVYRLAMKDSIEERIMHLHAEKRALADSLFSGEEFGGAWSVDDLMKLLRDEG